LARRVRQQKIPGVVPLPRAPAIHSRRSAQINWHLWGLGQRLFFLHDGRATSSNGGLLKAIQDHAGSGSEANGVINLFQQLNSQQQQDLLNFLRSL
jgi:CxxC motif-containing protein (DUF1111 family)